MAKKKIDSNFLISVSNRFAILHIFYKELRSGDNTESCLWLWVNFHLKVCLVLVWPVSNIKKTCLLLVLSHYN